VTEEDRTLARSAEEPLDEVDAATLDAVRRLYEEADPVPDDLVERIGFALALDEVYDEVARMTRLPLDALATRSASAEGTRTGTLTFSAERMTVMVTVTRVSVGALRLDGWIAPPDTCLVRLRMQAGGEHEVLADAQGRFSLDPLPEGFGQLSFHPAGEDGHTVVTPLFQL
jgi:hypothetical protein